MKLESDGTESNFHRNGNYREIFTPRLSQDCYFGQLDIDNSVDMFYFGQLGINCQLTTVGCIRDG